MNKPNLNGDVFELDDETYKILAAQMQTININTQIAVNTSMLNSANLANAIKSFNDHMLRTDISSSSIEQQLKMLVKSCKGMSREQIYELIDKALVEEVMDE